MSLPFKNRKSCIQVFFIILTILGLDLKANTIENSSDTFSSPEQLIRKPYLQKSSPTSMTICWKTSIPETSVVRYGEDMSRLDIVKMELKAELFHEITVTNLSPETRYYYVIGDTAGNYTRANKEQYFTSSPISGKDVSTRIWVIGDSGTGDVFQRNVRDAYLVFTAKENRKADLMLMLGDNAYESGYESQYQSNLFDIYDSIMMNTVLFPTSGNHDFYGGADPITQTGPYFDVFALPTKGECGGVPSGTEAYYSFDYGDIHLVSLETYILDRSETGEMAQWLITDLASSKATWKIVYWHYAPYSKVGHDSDDPDDHYGKEIEMREVFNPIVESFGVDLVLSGHSHSYERSVLLDGHYGYSSSLMPHMILNATSGDAAKGEAYEKGYGSTHSGTVYMVCGNSGRLDAFTGTAFHPAMYRTIIDTMGSVILDVHADSLRSRFIDSEGIVRDQFHIVKTSPATRGGQIKQGAAFKIYPNPIVNRSKLIIHPLKEMKWSDAMLKLFDSKGVLVKSIFLNDALSWQDYIELDLCDVNPGLYELCIDHSGNVMHLERLIVVEE